MYEALRQRAPNSSKAAGVASTILITGFTGYALANGLGGEIARMIPPPVVLTNLPTEKDEATPVVEKLPIDRVKWPDQPLPPIPDYKFVIDNGEKIVAHGNAGSVDPNFSIGPPRPPARKAPKLVSTEKPPYPASEMRARNEGTTRLRVCGDAKGRVASASLVRSSGHARLDDAALKWVRNARFVPGSVDGAVQSMCGHGVDYEWKLEEAAR